MFYYTVQKLFGGGESISYYFLKTVELILFMK